MSLTNNPSEYAMSRLSNARQEFLRCWMAVYPVLEPEEAASEAAAIVQSMCRIATLIDGEARV